MYVRLLIILLVFASKGFSEDDIPKAPLLTSIDTEPSGIIDGCVNVISGCFFEHDVDMVVPGPEPLKVERMLVDHAWSFNDMQFVGTYEFDERYSCEYFGSLGDQLSFPFKSKKPRGEGHPIELSLLKNGYINTSKGVIGAQTNIRNNEFQLNTKEDKVQIVKSDGSLLKFNRHGWIKAGRFGRKYRAYFLEEEISPNFLKKNFAFDNADELVSFSLNTWDDRNLSEVIRQEVKSKESREVTYTAPDGRSVSYKFNNLRQDKYPYSGTINEKLQTVIRSDKPSVVYGYNGRIHSRYNPDHRFINLQYGLAKLVSLQAPLGSDTTPLEKYHFDYFVSDSGSGCTAVHDALNRKTEYTFNDRNRLTSIVKFDETGAPYTIESLHWGPQDTHKEVELIKRTFGRFGRPDKTFTKTYGYDVLGNVVVEYLYGNLTGNGTSDCLVKSHEYSQDKLHLLLKTTVGTKSIRNVYLPDTNLVSACYHADAGKTYLRHFYTYDDTGMVVEHILDDGIGEDADDLTGITERKIERIERSANYPAGLPLVVTELCLDLETGDEILVGKKVNTFDLCGRLLREELYGNDGMFAFSKAKEYDAHGNVILETREDGASIVREYDDNDNMILEVGPNPLLSKRFFYDYMNRLIKIEEHHPDIVLSKHFRYDLCGNLIAKIDAMGNQTCTEYDAFNRPINVAGAGKYEYNEMSMPVKITTPDGAVTEFAYTLYGKPCKIAYPDGSQERFEYDIEGRMIKGVAKNGSTTLYTYDAESRVTHTVQLDAFGAVAWQTRSIYSTFRLLEEIDAAGNSTRYTYDCYGRKTAEQKGEYVTNFEYDTLNRLCKTTISGSSKCMVMNCLNQLIEERTENLQGDVLSCTRYAYDIDGNKVMVEQGESVATLKIDTHGIPLEAVDADGNVTHTRLDWNYCNAQGQRVIKTETTDPLGITAVVIKDVQGRVAEQLKLDSFGQEIQRTAYLYDSAGNCIRTIEAVYRGEEEAPDIINVWEYNSMNQLVASIQAWGQPEQKRVTHLYNGLGQRTTTIKPDGSSIYYSYDGLGRLFEEQADSIHYRYTYDVRSNPVFVEDLLTQSATIRNYDQHNRITYEKLANGLELNIAYNPDGGIKKVTLPDQSTIDYTYNGPLLTAVERNGYRHTYNSYDHAGNPLEATLINNLGKLSTSYTLKGQPKELKSDYYSESLTYDAVNNVLCKAIHGEESNRYAYDPLNQLISESGHFNHQYTNDSLYNRTSKDGKKHTLNSLNSLLSDGEAAYTYDACGNVTSYTKNGKAYTFTYDDLDRLTTLKINDATYNYTYDEQNRCISRQDEKILYIGQCDIGTIDPQGNLQNLRVIGKGIGAEIGAAIAIEIRGEVFAPLHDHQGSVVALIDSNGQTRESYRYSAFGEEETFSPTENPWRFSSKRKEADFNLFGRRFYNPEIGRWLTPDPIGHSAGPNLYAYVSNTPLTRIDPFGLTEESPWAEFAYNVLYCAWSFAQDTFKNSVQYGKEALHYAGQGIKLAVHHCVPIPLVKDCGCMFGYFLETGSLDNYPVSYLTDTSDSFDMPGAPRHRRIEFIAVNGICNSHEDAKEFQQSTSDLYDGYNVHLAYNGTDGFVADILECIAQKFGIVTPSVRETINTIRKCINNVGGVGSDGIVKIDAHSQGGIILSLALQNLTPGERSMLCVSTYGSGAFISEKGLKSCANYVSKRDPVSFIGNLVGYIPTRLGLRPEVVYLDPQEGGLEHRINCKTYTKAREYDAQQFKDKYF